MEERERERVCVPEPICPHPRRKHVYLHKDVHTRVRICLCVCMDAASVSAFNMRDHMPSKRLAKEFSSHSFLQDRLSLACQFCKCIIIIIIIIIIMALEFFVGPWPLFQLLDPVPSRSDFLGGGSARRKATTYTQSNTNTE
jgi:hypothetical protein